HPPVARPRVRRPARRLAARARATHSCALPAAARGRRRCLAVPAAKIAPVIIVMKAEFGPDAEEPRQVIRMAERFPDIHTELHVIRGSTRTLTEIYLLGPTSSISSEPFADVAAVEKGILS